MLLSNYNIDSHYGKNDCEYYAGDDDTDGKRENDVMLTMLTMMTSEMAMIRIVTTAGVGSCEASLDGVRNTPDTRDAFLPVSLYYFRRR